MENPFPGKNFFEIIGSTDQFNVALQRHLQLLGSDYDTLTLIINLNNNHWTTVVMVREGGRAYGTQENLVKLEFNSVTARKEQFTLFLIFFVLVCVTFLLAFL